MPAAWRVGAGQRLRAAAVELYRGTFGQTASFNQSYHLSSLQFKVSKLVSVNNAQFVAFASLLRMFFLFVCLQMGVSGEPSQVGLVLASSFGEMDSGAGRAIGRNVLVL